jgi:hypothetical protein
METNQGKQKFNQKWYTPMELLNKLKDSTYGWLKHYTPIINAKGMCMLLCNICKAAGKHVELSTGNVSDAIKAHESSKGHTDSVKVAQKAAQAQAEKAAEEKQDDSGSDMEEVKQAPNVPAGMQQYTASRQGPGVLLSMGLY